MDSALVVTRSVRYEDTRVVGLFRDPVKARKFAKAEAWNCRLPALREWVHEDDPDHIGSFECGDVTWVVRRYPIR